MAITRTNMIDDDGSGTTGTIINNAWKQELYNQIDALPVAGAWTPIDISGAGLALTTIGGCRYWRYDKLVMIVGSAVYPTTSTGHRSQIGGLPVANNGSSPGGLYPTLAPLALHFYISAGASSFYPFTAAGADLTNAQLSGMALYFSGVYATA